MTLIDEAERAEKIRNAFIYFSVPCSDNLQATQDINKAVSELSSLSCVLRDIQRLIDTDSGEGLRIIERDLRYVHEDVTFTLEDIWQCIGRLGRGYTAEEYQGTWREISEQSIEATGSSLHTVLEEYRRIMESLSKTFESHVLTPTVANSRDRMKSIYAGRSGRPLTIKTKPTVTKEGRSSSRRTATLGRSNSTSKPPLDRSGSSERSRTPKPTGPQSPKSPEMKQPKSYERQRPMSPSSSSISSVSDTTRLKERTWGPSPPLSPAATMSLISQVTSLQDSDLEFSHWAKSVYKGASATPLPWSQEETRYHEQRSTVKEDSYPNQAYESVLSLLYPEGVRVSLFCRPIDYRAKMVVLYRDHKGKQDFACLPLEALQIRREGSVLRIYRIGSKGKLLPWATMKFTTIENLILFANTFVSMRSQQDFTTLNITPPPLYDIELRDENIEFAGKIFDSGFKHRLRIFQDKSTHTVRIQASVLEGELDRTPVWTAFITDALQNPEWCHQVNKNSVALADLKLHVFSARYQIATSQIGPGVFVLRFAIAEDAEAFLEVIDSLQMSLGGLEARATW